MEIPMRTGATAKQRKRQLEQTAGNIIYIQIRPGTDAVCFVLGICANAKVGIGARQRVDASEDYLARCKVLDSSTNWAERGRVAFDRAGKSFLKKRLTWAGWIPNLQASVQAVVRETV